MNMPIPNLAPATIQRHTTDNSYARGQDYCRAGTVRSLTQRQQTLQADVEGNSPTPYRITIDFDGGGITNAHCTCLYNYEGWCKHIVATLLTCIRQPEKLEQRPALAQLLDRLNLGQIQGLVQRLVAENPSLIESVDWYVSQLTQPESAPTPTSPPKRKTSVDPIPFKRRAREILRSAVRDWEYGQDDDDIAVDMGALIDNALDFLAHGDGPNALVALQGITEGCMENWDVIDDFCGLTPQDMDLDFDAAWAEVLLSAELTEDGILAWQEKLETWQDQLGSFAMSLEALRQGWDYPPLVRVLQGETSEQGAWSGDAPGWANEFSQIRLKILARQERHEDYLRLAAADGQTQQYLTMLGRLGRVDQAMTVAQTQMTTLEEAKALAETLGSQNQRSQALQIALHGLRFDDNNPDVAFDFATWTADLAEGIGDPDAALEASIIAFKSKPSFQDYQKLKALAGADWPDIQGMLLQYLRTSEMWRIEQAQVNVFLHERLLTDAIAVVSGLHSYHSGIVLRVMDAVTNTHSQWVIDNARPRAESIMDEGKAKYYHHAVEWLKRVKAAFQALGKGVDWSRYHQALIDTHGRKRKLIGLMQQGKL
ncbi:MAG: SWIM zinc finger family protein [Cyanobacteria bacterium J06639_16]